MYNGLVLGMFSSLAQWFCCVYISNTLVLFCVFSSELSMNADLNITVHLYNFVLF